jgi:predicted metal-dependent hydrolase
MQSQWGSCTLEARSIRISNRLAAFPQWVSDYVIVHELAHLQVGPHNREFWALVRRYPKTERAIGFLIAKA